MTQHQFYVGMGTLDDLLDIKSLEPPQIMLNTCIESLPSAHPSIRFKKFSVIASRLDGNLCYYWRYHTGSVDDWGHGNSDEKLEAAQQRTCDAFDILKSYIEKPRGLTVIKALVATPKNLVFLDGTTDLIRYDKEKDTYIGTAASDWEE